METYESMIGIYWETYMRERDGQTEWFNAGVATHQVFVYFQE